MGAKDAGNNQKIGAAEKRFASGHKRFICNMFALASFNPDNFLERPATDLNKLVESETFVRILGKRAFRKAQEVLGKESLTYTNVRDNLVLVDNGK